MTAQDAVGLIQLLNRNQIEVIVDGGWGVDALLGKQTRTHADLDVAVEHKDVPKIRDLMEAGGGTRSHGETHGNATLSWATITDIYSISIPARSMRPEIIFFVKYPYPEDRLNRWFPVKCITPEWMVKFHSGYKLDEERLSRC